MSVLLSTKLYMWDVSYNFNNCLIHINFYGGFIRQSIFGNNS